MVYFVTSAKYFLIIFRCIQFQHIWFIAPLKTNVTAVLRVNCSLVQQMIFYNTMDCCVKNIRINYIHSLNFLKWISSFFLSIFEFFLLFWCCSVFLVWIIFLAVWSRFLFLTWCCFESLSWILFLVVSSRFFLLLWCRFISLSWILVLVVSSRFFLLCWCCFVFLAWILFSMVLSRSFLLSCCCVLFSFLILLFVFSSTSACFSCCKIVS